jgi:hypothetical protein
VGKVAPTGGQELTNAKLSFALRSTHRFEAEDLEAFELAQLQPTDYIESDGSFFQPARSDEISYTLGDQLRPIVRKRGRSEARPRSDKRAAVVQRIYREAQTDEKKKIRSVQSCYRYHEKRHGTAAAESYWRKTLDAWPWPDMPPHPKEAKSPGWAQRHHPGFYGTAPPGRMGLWARVSAYGKASVNGASSDASGAEGVGAASGDTSGDPMDCPDGSADGAPVVRQLKKRPPGAKPRGATGWDEIKGAWKMDMHLWMQQATEAHERKLVRDRFRLDRLVDMWQRLVKKCDEREKAIRRFHLVKKLIVLTRPRTIRIRKRLIAADRAAPEQWWASVQSAALRRALAQWVAIWRATVEHKKQEAQKLAQKRLEDQARAAAEQRWADYTAANQKDCLRLGIPWRSQREGSDELGIVRASGRVYLKETPSMADIHAMERCVHIARERSKCLGGLRRFPSPQWDMRRSRYFMEDMQELNHVQEWLPEDVIESWVRLTRYSSNPGYWQFYKLDSIFIPGHRLTRESPGAGMCDDPKYRHLGYGDIVASRATDPDGRPTGYTTTPPPPMLVDEPTIPQWESDRDQRSRERALATWKASRPAKVKAAEAVEDARIRVHALKDQLGDIEERRGPETMRHLEEAEAAIVSAVVRQGHRSWDHLRWESRYELQGAIKGLESRLESYGAVAQSLQEAEATLADATRRFARVDVPEGIHDINSLVKASETERQYAAHFDVVRERHSHLARVSSNGGKEGLVRLCKANALPHSGSKSELLERLVNADAHGCASQCDKRGRQGRCPRCGSKLRLVCAPSGLQPNEPIRLECPKWGYQKSERTVIRTYTGASFKPCGWKVDITSKNKRELLSVRMKDSWQGDLAKVSGSGSGGGTGDEDGNEVRKEEEDAESDARPAIKWGCGALF